MITAIKIFLPDGKVVDLVVGKGGVKKAFFDREVENKIVVLMDDNIVEYTNCPSVAMKDYKAEAK